MLISSSVIRIIFKQAIICGTKDRGHYTDFNIILTLTIDLVLC